MKKLIVALFVGATMSLYALEEDVADAKVDVQDDEHVTVITSDKLTFDYKKQFAIFENHVVVTDPGLKLTSDKLKVVFDDEGEVDDIRANGNVIITQADKTSTSSEAHYEVSSGKIVLQGDPRVHRGKDYLVGDVITFWRDENKMICEPRARLVIYADSDGSRAQLFGE